MNESPDQIAVALPLPPPLVQVSSDEPCFVPAPELASFVGSSLLKAESALYNVEHDHLGSARIAFLWTNSLYIRRDKIVLGTAELVGEAGMSWGRARAYQQLRDWFPGEPIDFLITLYAPCFFESSMVLKMCVLEHELYHCGHKQDQYECPKFKPDGSPVFYIKGHDIEEFLGVGKRYGAVTPELAALKETLSWTPEFDGLRLSKFCGVC